MTTKIRFTSEQDAVDFATAYHIKTGRSVEYAVDRKDVDIVDMSESEREWAENYVMKLNGKHNIDR